MRIDRRTATALGTLAAAVILGLLSWVLSSGDDGGGGAGADRGEQTTSVRSSTSTSTSGASLDPDSGLPLVSADDLPEQARETLDLIDRGGPFPYDRDGIVFGNYEGLLPQERSGYYHEYTVPTPGESDRGARRIIAGSDDERYWTADHYESFERVDR